MLILPQSGRDHSKTSLCCRRNHHTTPDLEPFLRSERKHARASHSRIRAVISSSLAGRRLMQHRTSPNRARLSFLPLPKKYKGLPVEHAASALLRVFICATSNSRRGTCRDDDGSHHGLVPPRAGPSVLIFEVDLLSLTYLRFQFLKAYKITKTL